MKKIIMLVMMICFLCNAAFAEMQMTAASKQPINVSYVQTSPFIKVKAIKGKSNTFAIELQSVAPVVTYFSDRPNRVVGQVTTDSFLKKWTEGKDSFSKDAPNAVLSGIVKKGLLRKGFVSYVVELTKPVYSASNNTITYEAHILGDNAAKVDFNKIYYATLFIDDVCLSCIGGNG